MSECWIVAIAAVLGVVGFVILVIMQVAMWRHSARDMANDDAVLRMDVEDDQKEIKNG